jgi:hypothetical protein
MVVRRRQLLTAQVGEEVLDAYFVVRAMVAVKRVKTRRRLPMQSGPQKTTQVAPVVIRRAAACRS